MFLCYNCRGRSGIPGKHCTYRYRTFTDNCTTKKCGCECRKFYLDESGKKQPIYIPPPIDIEGGLDNWA